MDLTIDGMTDASTTPRPFDSPTSPRWPWWLITLGVLYLVANLLYVVIVAIGLTFTGAPSGSAGWLLAAGLLAAPGVVPTAVVVVRRAPRGIVATIAILTMAIPALVGLSLAADAPDNPDALGTELDRIGVPPGWELIDEDSTDSGCGEMFRYCPAVTRSYAVDAPKAALVELEQRLEAAGYSVEPDLDNEFLPYLSAFGSSNYLDATAYDDRVEIELQSE